MRYILVLFFLLSPHLLAKENAGISGFTETVFIVSDMQSTASMLTDVGGWHVISTPEVDKQLAKLWQLPATAKFHQMLLANKGEQRGYMRLIEIDGVKQQLIRPNTQSWDTGGIFDVNMRVKNIATKRDQLLAKGWFSATDPIQFNFGPYVVKEWIVKNADGVAFALIERIAPELTDWPNLKGFSRVFNSTQVVPDIEKSLPFYTDVLGFKTYLKHKGASKEQGPNVLGLPHNLTTEIGRSVYILHPDGVNEGSVELLQFHGASGRDLSINAAPPNIGIVTLRFPVEDLAALKQTFTKNNIDIVSETQLNLPPYGLVDILAIKTPDQTWIEFYQIK